ncbi:Calcium and integrin-binding family member 2 like protein [Argiope bruennichi]|uniref:Calcium and integrin-binding family member 2 like protein n=2 Tax=Argiope bruennichi TaxID=94029 RepID=A0A8T0FW71_ARGBR|nr:Calcium and integrin-binding family member 2 like protein [Argiope bruennichi]
MDQITRPLIQVRRLMKTQEVFTEEELLDFQKLTYLSRKQIIKLYKEFCSFHPDMQNPKNPVLPQSFLLLMPELKVNPFLDRIIKVFCSQLHHITFEDFLDMMSIFCEEAPIDVKTSYAFRIYDFDDDDMFSREDIQELLSRLTCGNELSDEDYAEIIECVFLEADLDTDGYISYPEFEQLITKSPDFIHAFRMRI